MDHRTVPQRTILRLLRTRVSLNVHRAYLSDVLALLCEGLVSLEDTGEVLKVSKPL